ncbi:MAG: AAA family ATPase [Vulcanimicrobiota bacterium]
MSVLSSLRNNLEQVILGKPAAVEHLLVALVAGGHVLMEDVPGVGKTTLARALAQTIAGEFARIQFTPDLLPADVLGVSVYNAAGGTFDFKKGPVFANILLADEINRASPRTQSALLQAMSEAQATVDGTTYDLPSPFMVLATQNPIEFHGTYPLPEAQLDRFLLQTSLGYPDPETEVEVLFGQAQQHPLERLQAVVDTTQVLELQAQARQITVERSVARYMVDLVEASRRHSALSVGASPRGSLALFRCCRARALIDGRDYCQPDDVKALAEVVLAHRLVLDVKARYAGTTAADVVGELLAQVAPPT